MTRELGRTCLSWWSTRLRADLGAARALRARLRRAEGPVAALSEGAVHDLARALAAEGLDLTTREDGPGRLAALAHLLAWVEEHDPAPLARRFGGDPPALSNLRFQRLLRAGDAAELAFALRRALPLVDDRCNVARLAEDVLWWGDAVRARWCFDYFGAPVPESLKAEAAADQSPGPARQETP